MQNFPQGISIFQARGIIYQNLFNIIKNNVVWDISMKSRKTASFGLPYNYSNIAYEVSAFPKYILEIVNDLKLSLGYTPNNCLINYYDSGKSSMGFHSDSIDILFPSTGITILSLGKLRTMRFKNKITGEINDVQMMPNYFLHMDADLQNEWLHSVLSADLDDMQNERISLTFRYLI